MKKKGDKSILPRTTDKENRVMSLKDEYDNDALRSKNKRK